MKKKTVSAVFTALLLILMLIPLLGLLLFGPQEAVANERLHAAPALTDRDGGFNAAFLNDLSDYFADRFALRREFSALWARLNAVLLRTSAEKQVLLGRDGWLYYSETLDDYRGAGLSDEALSDIADNLRLMQESLAEREIDLLFVIAPNKNSLYGEHMPGWIEDGHDASNAARLLPMLSARGAAALDLFELLRAEPETLYYRTDSHWNAKGAALAADAICEALGREGGYYVRPFTLPAEHLGDLYEMLYPGGTELEATFESETVRPYVCLNDPRGGEAITIRTECETADGALFCWRDSFGNALYPYLAQSFGKAVFSRSAAYDLTQPELAEADAVVLELVERNLRRLWEQAAVFPAPERALTAQRTEAQPLRVTVTPVEGGLVRVSAVLPRAAADAGSEICFAAGGRCWAACRLSAPDADCVTVTACLDAAMPEVDGLVLYVGGMPTLLPAVCEGAAA